MKDAPETKNPETDLTRGAPPWHGRARWHGRATQHGQVVPHHWPAGSCWMFGVRPCVLTPVRAFACLRVLPCSWCPGLPRTSTLLLNPPKMLSLLPKLEGSS